MHADWKLAAALSTLALIGLAFYSYSASAKTPDSLANQTLTPQTVERIVIQRDRA
ncbi:MAG: hypothetical protein AB8F78_18405 [Saprospiraceae bacterium]